VQLPFPDLAAQPPRRGTAALAVLLPFAAGYYVSYLFRSVNAVIAPELTRELGIGPRELGFLTSTYFFTFAAAQLPVGVALDRFGPRRVLPLLLLLAAAGGLIFATGHQLSTLAFGRGLIGLGVAASLMGALKAFSTAFARGRQTSVTGFIMAAGAFGALSASLPIEWLLPVWGWRGSFVAVAVMSLVAAALIAFMTPAPPAPPETRAQDASAAAFATILRSPAFWRYAPQAALFTGGYMALQGLWAGPWLMQVAGDTRTAAALGLTLLNLGALAGQLAIGFWAGRLHRAGLARAHLMSLGLGLSLLVMAAIVVWPNSGDGPWFLFGFFAAASAQVYGITAEAFPPALSGRVSTAVNQFAFVGAFALQWGIGAAIESLSRRVAVATAFRLTFGGLLVLQVLAVAWATRPVRIAKG
jgi:predicted MFS family arabinose efflux permease